MTRHTADFGSRTSCHRVYGRYGSWGKQGRNCVKDTPRVADNPLHRVQVCSVSSRVEIFELNTSQRDAYFTLINLIGAGTFLVVGDYHRQRDGVVEAEAARIDDAIQKIRDAAN